MLWHIVRQAVLLFIFVLPALLFAPRIHALETDCVVHDPSTIVQSGSTYWVFGSGRGITVYSSLDKRHWKPEQPVFSAPPTWVAAAVPGHRGDFFWAPDIRYVHGRYCLYYAVSTFGHNTSAIGLATSPTLEAPHWTDQGIVVRSSPRDDFNAIDPCITADAKGRLWLGYGSFWSGIKLSPLDAVTGKAMSGPPQVYSLASHPQNRADSIEAPFIYAHKGYYYLFVNWDLCCRGERSTYNIRVGRSRSVLGPYLDKTGHDLRSGGGSKFLPAVAENSPGARGIGSREIGPGHAGIFSDTEGDWFSCHYEWAEDHQGQPMLNIQKLTWTPDGWPTLAAP